MKLGDILSEEQLHVIEGIGKNIQKFLHNNQSFFNNLYNAINKVANQANEFFQNPTVQSAIKKVVDNYPKEVRECIVRLANYGWFIDLKRVDINDLFPLVSYLDRDSVDEVESWLCKKYQESLGEILKEITENYPNRKKIFEKAFNAHKNGDYELSIPVLLTQVDGICYDKTSKYLFMSKAGKQAPQTEEYFKNIVFNSILDSLLEPLKVKISLNLSEAQRKNQSLHILNRHQVIHGEVTNYATEANSYKIISLLSYINFVFIEIGKEKVEPLMNKPSAECKAISEKV